MKTSDILYAITTKGFDTRYSWSKDYGNGTSLFEFKIYKTRRHRKPLAFIQIGFYNDTKDVIGFTFSYMPKPNEVVDCATIEDLYRCLGNLA